MTQHLREIVIPKEHALFWLDADGRWRNSDGRFRHKKIIDHFHASISKDANGYFVRQQKGDFLEKVYFHYEDTALFVFQVILGTEIILVLNTQKKIRLHPERLFLRNDNLYVMEEGDIIKFTEHALIKISNIIDEIDGHFYITINGVSHKIHEKK